MLKVKRTIYSPQKKDNNQLNEIENDIKNSIKELYLKDKKRDKIINKYSQLMTNIRNEYAELTKENNQLKKDLLQFQEHYKQQNQKFVTRKPKKKI